MATSGRRNLGEFEIIARFFAPLAADAPGALGLLDDAALMAVGEGCEAVVSTDAMVEGVHFLADDPPSSLAHKLLAVGLSDIAAMGARAKACTVVLGLPTTWIETALERWLADFAGGLEAASRAFGVALIGGDIVGTPGPLSLTLTALGEVAAGRELRRSGARPGDGVYVSGTVGDAALGLKVLRGELVPPMEPHGSALAARYRMPSPRLALGERLSGLAHAAADVSDGLVADLGHICKASGTQATLDATKVPLSDAARAVLAVRPQALAAILTGGDDYELVFTAPDAAADALAAAARDAGCPVARIGRIEASDPADGGPPVRVVDSIGAAIDLAADGWHHF